jgi:hypothetical protein
MGDHQHFHSLKKLEPVEMELEHHLLVQLVAEHPLKQLELQLDQYELHSKHVRY